MHIHIHKSLKEMTHFHGNLPEAIFKNSVSRISPDDIVSYERVIRKHLNMAESPRKGVKTVIAVIPTAIFTFHNNNTNQYKPLQTTLNHHLWAICGYFGIAKPQQLLAGGDITSAAPHRFKLLLLGISVGFVHGETMGLPAKSIRIEGCPVNCLVNQFKASIYINI